MIKENSYIVITGDMITEFQLKGAELIVYAVINGFSQDGEGLYKGSLAYLQDWTKCSRQGVINCLKKLTERGLIDRKERFVNGVKFVDYSVKKVASINTLLNTCINTNTYAVNKVDTRSIHAKDDQDFETFWAAYPKDKHKNKADARKAWQKEKPNLSVCLSALKEQEKTYQWKKNGGQFIPYPATWINGHRWENEITENDKRDPGRWHNGVYNGFEERENVKIDYSDIDIDLDKITTAEIKEIFGSKGEHV